MMLIFCIGLLSNICITGVICPGAFWKAAKPDRQGRRKGEGRRAVRSRSNTYASIHTSATHESHGQTFPLPRLVLDGTGSSEGSRVGTCRISHVLGRPQAGATTSSDCPSPPLLLLLLLLVVVAVDPSSSRRHQWRASRHQATTTAANTRSCVEWVVQKWGADTFIGLSQRDPSTYGTCWKWGRECGKHEDNLGKESGKQCLYQQ